MSKCIAYFIHEVIRKIFRLFFARNHPIYQNILFQHVPDKFLIASELASIMDKFVSGSKADTQGKCQGENAMLEQLSKESKSWLKMSRVLSNYE